MLPSRALLFAGRGPWVHRGAAPVANRAMSAHTFPELGPFDLLRAKPIKPVISEEDEDRDDILDTGDIDPRYRLGRHLMAMGRVPYRMPVPLPDWILERKDEIAGRRTPSQVRRCLKDWMLKFDRDEQKTYLNRPLKWAQSVNPNSKIKVYPYGPEETIAYSNYFFPGRYAVLRRLLGDLKAILPEFVPSRIVDFGCGPATGAAVAVDVFGRESIQKYAGIDMSQSMQDAAQIMTNNLGVDCSFWSKTSDLVKRALNDDSERFDLAICSYTLSELANDPARRAAVQILFELLDCGGVVIFVEKGNPQGSFAVRTARQLLLTMNDPQQFITNKKKVKDEEGKEVDVLDRTQYVLRAPLGMTHMETDIRTLAPCTHDKPCPLADTYYCSFSQKVFGSMIHNQQAEKFSYVMMQKRKRTVFVKEKGPGESESIKSLQAYTENRKELRNLTKKTIVLESKLHSRRAGGLWLGNPNENITEFPSPIAVLRRFQSLGPDANRPVEDDDSSEIADSEEDLERNLQQELGDADKKGGRKARPFPVRIQDDDSDEMDEEYDDDDDDLDDTIQFQRPKTHVDVLVDQLIDEIDWEEYKPPLYRSEWGRILRTPIKSKGHILMDLCMPSGEIVRSTFAKSNILPVPQLYKALRKTSWGGLFPAGTGDEDNKSVLMKNPKKTMTGLSSIRVKQRLQQEAELLSRNSVQNKKSDVNDVNPTTKGRRSNLRNAQQQPPLKATKTLHEAQVVPGKNVPFHSTFLRSKEYINRDETAMMEKEKETMKIMKIESKRRSISKMGDAFRKRQAAKQGDAEEIEAN